MEKPCHTGAALMRENAFERMHQANQRRPPTAPKHCSSQLSHKAMAAAYRAGATQLLCLTLTRRTGTNIFIQVQELKVHTFHFFEDDTSVSPRYNHTFSYSTENRPSVIFSGHQLVTLFITHLSCSHEPHSECLPSAPAFGA